MKKSIHNALQEFAASVTAKMTQITTGQQEDQLRGPFETFMVDAAQALGWNVVCTGETPLPDRIGRPDYAVHLNGLLAGYVELKAPGVGATHTSFKRRDQNQFKRFSSIPNILYTDGNEWAIYRSGERVGSNVHLEGDVASDGRKSVVPSNAIAIERLLRDFMSWKPNIPRGKDGKIDLKGFALLLAPLCRMLRDDVKDAVGKPTSPLVQVAEDWRQLLFPDARDEQFADAYAQTVTFALLLGKSEGADPLTLDSAQRALEAQHNLLSKALDVLTHRAARGDIAASLDLLLRVIGVVPPTALTDPRDPWLYFYEEFLSVYDPNLRKDVGAYYTPVEVVRAQVRLIDDLLVRRLAKPLGFADPSVFTLDPAVGTGTYLLGVIEHALGRVKAEQGLGAVPAQATTLAKNIYGFELMVGPYAVSELRVNRALSDYGATLPETGTHIYLTDTLESPNAEPPKIPFILQSIAEQHEKAIRIKNTVPVIVCLGNPPYDRHSRVDVESEDNLSRYGGWIRFDDPLPDNVVQDKRGRKRELKTAKSKIERRQEIAILRDFRDPAIDAGHGGHLKNLYNLYVYFWRWALWKVFEHNTAKGPGIVSFISASSYLDGDAFCGMREHMRRVCDEIWVLDLGGEGHGAIQSENVFAIRTPVSIAVAVRYQQLSEDTPAKTQYALIEGSRPEKLHALNSIDQFASVTWQDCADDWQAPFRPAGRGEYFSWPLITELMPWQHSGVQLKRTWPIAPDIETLEHRWRGLLSARDRSEAFRETGDREIDRTYRIALTQNNVDSTPISELTRDAPVPEMQRYAYRSLDRHCIIADGRLMSRPRPDIWRAHGARQVYLTTLLSEHLGGGPAATACAQIPDLHHFSGRGAKDTVPLYRTASATDANITPNLLDILSGVYQKNVTPEDFLAYVYGTLAHPDYTERFKSELNARELRVPLTKDAPLFEQGRALGSRLLWLHTYGERLISEDQPRGHVPQGAAKCVKGVPEEPENYPETINYSDVSEILCVGEGVFRPVPREVYEFEVSGLKVVVSWLKYRMKKGAGRKSSPLDKIRPERWTSQFTTELLDLLWVLEGTLKVYPEQARLLEAVIEGDCFRADELPPVPDEMRKPPKARPNKGDLFYGVKGE